MRYHWWHPDVVWYNHIYRGWFCKCRLSVDLTWWEEHCVWQICTWMEETTWCMPLLSWVQVYGRLDAFRSGVYDAHARISTQCERCCWQDWKSVPRVSMCFNTQSHLPTPPALVKDVVPALKMSIPLNDKKGMLAKYIEVEMTFLFCSVMPNFDRLVNNRASNHSNSKQKKALIGFYACTKQ